MAKTSTKTPATPKTAKVAIAHRASRPACADAAAALYAAAMESGTVASAQVMKLGDTYVPKGGSPTGQRTSLCVHVQNLVREAGGSLPWGDIRDTKFSYDNRVGDRCTDAVKKHITFLLGNKVITF